MSATYEELLDATIQHLEELKSHGVRHVDVSKETLRGLAQPAARTLQPFVPKPQAQVVTAPPPQPKPAENE